MTSAQTSPRVLVAHPDPDQLDYVAYALRLAGFPIRACPDGVAAVLAAYDYRPDVAVVPVDAPGLDADRLAGHLRGWAASVGRSLVLVGVAVDPGPDADTLTMAAGVDVVVAEADGPVGIGDAIDGVWRRWVPVAPRAAVAS